MEEFTHDFLSFLPAALLALAAVWRQAQGMGILYDFRGGSVGIDVVYIAV